MQQEDFKGPAPVVRVPGPRGARPGRVLAILRAHQDFICFLYLDEPLLSILVLVDVWVMPASTNYAVRTQPWTRWQVSKHSTSSITTEQRAQRKRMWCRRKGQQVLQRT